jgi:thiosulfate/3-mercaptopyruvate sulfurtransferase
VKKPDNQMTQTSVPLLISCEELHSLLNQKNVVIVDCSFELLNPERGADLYVQQHIPGAVYAHMDTDLSGPVTASSGRHPLPQPQAFQQSMSRLGIGQDTWVIAYDRASNSFAARLWFLLNYYGHSQVSLLDGGFTEWLNQNCPTETGKHHNVAKKFSGIPAKNWIVSTAEVEANLHHPNWTLIDARAPDRYAGQQETIDPVAGHIPGAINSFYGANLQTNGCFRSNDAIREHLRSILEMGKQPVVYCGSGVTSTHLLFAFALAGLPLPKLYAGSWSEWIRDPKRPIA